MINLNKKDNDNKKEINIKVDEASIGYILIAITIISGIFGVITSGSAFWIVILISIIFF